MIQTRFFPLRQNQKPFLALVSFLAFLAAIFSLLELPKADAQAVTSPGSLSISSTSPEPADTSLTVSGIGNGGMNESFQGMICSSPQWEEASLSPGTLGNARYQIDSGPVESFSLTVTQTGQFHPGGCVPPSSPIQYRDFLYSFDFSADISGLSNGTHTMAVMADDSATGATVSDTRVFTVDHGGGFGNIEVTLTANPPTVNSGQSTTLTWTTRNDPTSCTASSSPSDIWSGSKNPAGGSETVGPLTNPPASYIFTLTCSKVGFEDGSASVTVNVNASGGGDDDGGPTVAVDLRGATDGFSWQQSLSASAPLNGVDLRADVSGTALGPIDYTFDCGNGQAPVSGTSSVTPITLINACDYPSAGNYTASVNVTRQGVSANDSLPVDVTSPTFFTLTITKSGAGSGTVTSSAAGINCGSDCGEVYPAGTIVTLNASADAGSVFAGWSGAGCSGTGSCIVAMNSDVTVDGRFDGAGAPSVAVDLQAATDGAAWQQSLSGSTPLNGVDLRADLTGTASGTISYTFDCGNGQGVISGSSATSPIIRFDICGYTAGNYTARVDVTRQSASAFDTLFVSVSSGITVSVDLQVATDGLNWQQSLSGTAPLNGVDLRADISGSATGTISYTFNCGNGQATISGSTSTSPITQLNACNYTSSGTYTASVSVTRQGVNASDTATINVSVTPTLSVDLKVAQDQSTWQDSLFSPVAPFNGIDVQGTVWGTATGNVTWQFDCTNNGTFEHTATNSGPTETRNNLCNYASAGLYTLRLTVIRQGVSASDTATIDVKTGVGLSVDLEAATNSSTWQQSLSSASAPLSGVELRATFTPVDSGPFTYQFDCTSDGTFEQVKVTSATVVASNDNICSYPTAGTYVARVTAIDGNSNATDTVIVTVGSVGSPTLSVDLQVATDGLNWQQSLSGTVPLAGVDLRGTVSGTATGSITYQFDCTDNGTFEATVNTSNNPETQLNLCSYSATGTYTARLTVTRQGVVASDTATITVNNPGVTPTPPSDVLGDNSQCQKITITWTDNSTNEDGFHIWRNQTGGTSLASYTLIRTESALSGTGSQGSYTDNSVVDNNSYYYAVTSFNTFGDSSISDGSTRAGPVIAAPCESVLSSSIAFESITKPDGTTSTNPDQLRNGDLLTLRVIIGHNPLSRRDARDIDGSVTLSTNFPYDRDFSCSLCTNAPPSPGVNAFTFTVPDLPQGQNIVLLFTGSVQGSTTLLRDILTASLDGEYNPGNKDFGASYSLLFRTGRVTPTFREIAP